jgi:small GTP-binding protein
MSRLPQGVWVALAILMAGVALVLLASIASLYADLSLISPMLANAVLAVIVLTILAAIAWVGLILLRWWQRSQRKQKRRPIAPQGKAEAAQALLTALEQQVAQIQDDVTRSVLRDRSQAIGQDLRGRSLRIVVFGTGSAGKTSLVNALIGRVGGQVAATIGTTTAEQTYTLRLRGLERRLELIDTPGLSEVGALGRQREQQVRQLAATADLLLFVIDNDLRQTDYAILRSLLDMGKRSLVVFNKLDLYPDADLTALLRQIHHRLADQVPADDLVAIAAQPRPVQLPGGEWVTPDPLLDPLLDRLALILRQDGETLIADTILLQSQRLSDDARQWLAQERRQRAEAIIDRYQWIGAGVIAATPLPGVDLVATAAVNAKMIVDIGQVYGCDLDLDSGKALALALVKTLAGLGILKGAIELLSLALQTNLATVLVGRAIQGATAAYLTRIAGYSILTYFQQGQDWGDGGMAEVVQHQFDLHRRDRLMQSFIQDAIARLDTILTPTSEA